MEQVGLEEKGATTPEPGCEEIRLALAMNGGVSLAVWMGGCTAELDRARLAGGEDQEKEGEEAAECEDGRSVYDVLADCFGRRLVIDVLTGTSAGGINAALLGGAIARGGEIPADFLRGKWIELGDLGTILHSSAAESPTSLMDGNLFHEKLGEAFEQLLENQTPSARAKARVRVPYLDVTMTDVLGVERRFRDTWGGELVAREHRPRFKFRRREHFTAAALADAARTSASFPFAFEPWRVTGRSRVLAGLPGQTWGIDGGLLDNAPIRGALDLIPTRRASAAVRRYFCYVNGDPLISREEAIGARPGLQEIGGYAITLPRTAPLVDHLYAIRDAVERPRRTGPAQERLLALELTHLEQVAGSLFETYARRRTLESLEEIVPEPSDAKATFEQLGETGGNLPWIPHGWQPDSEERWEWGLRPAQRILHLALDLLRPAIAVTGKGGNGVARKGAREKRRELLATRVKIESHLLELREAHERVTSADATNDPSKFEEEGAAARVNAACREATTRAPQVRTAVENGVKELWACMTTNQELFETSTREALFGTVPGQVAEVRCFIRRALAIEVVRRAFSAETDIESAEELSFVQLTPEAPSPIFSPNPIHIPGPVSAEQKLTGIGLGHFAGFFRRSWRANDFMWGRLDAAARIVDLLTHVPSSEFGVGAEAESTEKRVQTRAGMLTGYLRRTPERNRWLIEEALAAGEVDVEKEDLFAGLEKAIATELEAAETEPDSETARLPLTRVLFQRAAQVEVLEAELQTLLDESENDRKLGSGAKPLKLEGIESSESLKSRITAIRSTYRKGSSLPEELTGEGEAVSDLGLQTITHASFVGLAAVRTAGVPMSKYLGLGRPPLLAIAGTVASKWWVRATAALGFWAAAMFLTSRIVTEAGEPPAFSDVWSPETLLMLTGLLGVAGFVLVPGLRLRNGLSPFKNFLYTTALVACGGILAAGLAMIFADLSVEQLLFAPGAENPPEWVLWVILALLGVVSFARFPLPKWLKKLRPKIEGVRKDGRWMCALLAASFVLLSAFTVQSLVGSAYDSILQGDAALWRGISALVALILAPIAAGFAVSLGRPREVEPAG